MKKVYTRPIVDFFLPENDSLEMLCASIDTAGDNNLGGVVIPDYEEDKRTNEDIESGEGDALSKKNGWFFE